MSTETDKVAILIVDDHPPNLLALEAILSPLGQTLVQANSGEEALMFCLEYDFAVILLDAQMPTLDGVSTAELIRTRPTSQSTPIVFLTGHDSATDDIVRAYAAGAVDFLSKPVSPMILRSKISVFIDLYKKKREIERHRVQLKRTMALERSNSELEHFASVASNDLQEPLRGLTANLRRLEQKIGDQLDDESRTLIQTALNDSRQMSAMVNDLVKYSRVGAPGPALTMISLEEPVSRALANLRLSVLDNDATITRGDLPSIPGNALQLTRLFQNLIGNALKFRGVEPSEISITAHPSDDGWVVSVADNGIGLDPKFSERIFVIFQRLHAPEEYPGTGTGLAISKSIMDRHGGKIWVESALGAGATFHCSFPSID